MLKITQIDYSGISKQDTQQKKHYKGSWCCQFGHGHGLLRNSAVGVEAGFKVKGESGTYRLWEKFMNSTGCRTH